MPPDPVPRLDAVFAALADSTRRAILGLLLEDDMAVSDVAAEFPVSLAAVSRHLTVLRDAGLIRQIRQGRIIWCQINPGALRSAALWMQSLGQLEPVDLDRLEALLAAMNIATESPDPG